MTKTHRLSSVFSLFFDPKIPLLFLTGTFTTAIAGNAAYSLIIKLMGGDTTGNYLKILFGAVVALMFIVFMIKMILSTMNRQGSSEPSPAFEIPRKGIIYTVGNQTSTMQFSLDEQTPKFVGFICSKMSEPQVARVLDSMEFEGEDSYQKRPLLDPHDVVESESETKKLIDWMLSKGLQHSDIVVDVTGGMTTMSVGAFSMAEKMKIDTQYIKAQYDGTHPKGPGSGVLVRRYTQG